MRVPFDRRTWLPRAVAVAVGMGLLAQAEPVFAQVSTPTGTNVTVTFGHEAQVTFPEVVVAGETSLASAGNYADNAPPSNLTLCDGYGADGRLPYFWTTVVYNGTPIVCYTVDATCGSNTPSMFQGLSQCQEFCDGYTSDWRDVTTRRTSNVVCGTGYSRGQSAIGYPDRDHDKIADGRDNCPANSNANQADSDGDGVGNVCDSCPNTPTNKTGTEVCDGYDNDCDGSVDEGLGSLTCGQGICAHSVARCVNGSAGTCTDPMKGASSEVCGDGLDNDCDGSTDEGCADCYASRGDACTTSGRGVCRPGTYTCPNGQWGAAVCESTTAAGTEACGDGLDNDCDGSTDEGCTDCYASRGGSCATSGRGVCQAGTYTCPNGQWGNPVCESNTGPSPETCDGLDNDCDGDVDDGIAPIQCGVGACAREIAGCASGRPATCDPRAGAASSETCGNGIDDTCDGEVDEGCEDCFGVRGDRCNTGESGVCQEGRLECPSGQWGAAECAPVGGASSEICDGLDNDCDGRVDEDLGGANVACGVGACAHDVSSCAGGAPEACDPLAGSMPEVCDNGVDDDCNGRTDEGCEECLSDDDCDDADVCTTDVCADDNTCTSVPLCAAPKQCEAGACVDSEQGKESGAPCEEGTDCLSGYCVDGVCCDSACSGVCLACHGDLTGAETGTCAPVTAATDPQEECADDGPQSCLQDGVCDGEGACQLYVEGTSCSTDRCTSGGGGNAPDSCDGKGRCVEGGVLMCMPGYACVGFACKDSCAGDADCQGSHHCVDGMCVADLPRGAPCAAAGHCQSNFCVDGVCCDGACAGTCRACSVALKGYGADGLCEPVARGLDLEEECAPDGTTCGAPGLCDGTGACQRFASTTTPCGTTVCLPVDLNDLDADDVVSGSLCDGAGRCVDGSASCGAYRCDGDVCATVCAGLDDCMPPSFCSAAGLCAAPQGVGVSCGSNEECGSGFCVDGVCCESACEGQCAACDVAGLEGTCVAVTGQPHGIREACTGEGTPCAGSCDGLATDQCVYPGDGVACGGDACRNGAITTDRCDGAGRCAIQVLSDCAPFQCLEDLSCVGGCAADTDCIAGSMCVEGQCSAVNASRCLTETTALTASGTVSCFESGCVAGACLVGCESDADCGEQGLCQRATDASAGPGTCVPRAAAKSGDRKLLGCSGCAVRLSSPTGEEGSPWLWALGLLVTAAGVRRLRRFSSEKRTS